MSTRTCATGIIFFLLLSLMPFSSLADNLKPYILGFRGPDTIEGRLDEVRDALAREGFLVAGEYSPYDGAYVIVLTSDKLKDDAALSEFGAYGAIQRVSLTEADGELQISYTNPLYMAAAYRMDCDPSETLAKLEQALGNTGEFGSKNGRSSKDLRNYHYKVLMPHFNDHIKLASFPSQDEALSVIEKNLAAKTGGCEKIFRVDIPGKEETVFGIGINDGDGADEKVMSVTDFGKLKQTAHLPYELIVSDVTAYMLHGKFRIALSFPDLKMFTFMKISGAPGGIENAFKELTVKSVAE